MTNADHRWRNYTEAVILFWQGTLHLEEEECYISPPAYMFRRVHSAMLTKSRFQPLHLLLEPPPCVTGRGDSCLIQPSSTVYPQVIFQKLKG